MIAEKMIRDPGPTSQPSCAVAHARESTPEPITAVIIWALAVPTVPAIYLLSLCQDINKLKK